MPAAQSAAHRVADAKLRAAGLRHFEVRTVRRDGQDEIVGVALSTALLKGDPRRAAVCRLQHGRLVGLKVDV